jgi:VanZ family protein
MALIFFLSAQPDLNSGLGTIDLIGRKIVHATEYGLLTFLWWRALKNVPAAAAIAIAYACTDEFHQHFVHGRHASPVDVLIDGLGVAVASAIILRRR